MAVQEDREGVDPPDEAPTVRRPVDGGEDGAGVCDGEEEMGCLGRFLRYGVTGKPATSIVMLFLAVTLNVLPNMVLGPIKPSIIKSQFHHSMCPNITAAHHYSSPSSASSTSSEGYQAQADKDSSSGLVGAASAPVAGYLSDRFGRRPVMILSTLALSVPFLALATTCDTAWYLPLSVVIGSPGEVGMQVASYAYVADLTPRHLRSERFGVMLITITAAAFLGAPLGGYLSDLWGETDSNTLFWVCFGVAMLPFLFTVLVLAEPRRIAEEEDAACDAKGSSSDGKADGVRESWARLRPLIQGPLGVFLAVSFMVNLQSAGTQSLMGIYMTDAFPECGPECLGVQFIGFAVTMAFANGVLLPLLMRLCGENGTLWISLAGNLVHCVVFAFARRIWLLWANLILGAFALLSYTVLSGLVSSAVPKDLVGSALGASNSLWMVANVMSPLIFAYMFIEYTSMPESKTFPGLPWLLGAVFVALSMLVLGYASGKTSREGGGERTLPLLSEEGGEGAEGAV